jgi:hypothetical protein
MHALSSAPSPIDEKFACICEYSSIADAGVCERGHDHTHLGVSHFNKLSVVHIIIFIIFMRL